MGRAPCCDKASVKRGPWSPEEDAKLKEFIDKYGTGGNWIALPQKAGLRRCGKSCRLRWLNYLRPNIKHGEFSEDEDRIICTLFATIGSRWSVIAAQLPGRTDNDIKNYWNTKLKKKLMSMVETSHHHHLKNPQHDHQLPNNFSSFLHQPSPYNNYNSATAAPRPTLDLESPTSMYFMPQETFPSPIQNYQKTLMFDGGDQAISSSSSDGSQMDHHYNANYSYFNGGHHDHQVHGTHKLFGTSEAATATLDYDGLEEIKQLISTNSSGNIGNNVSNFMLPESRTAEERMLLYY